MNYQTLSLKFSTDEISILDQTLLPFKEQWVDVTDPETCVAAIKALKVRGAPLIGVVASLCFAINCRKEISLTQRLSWWTMLMASRPTAVNLIHLMNQLKSVIDQPGSIIFTKAFSFFIDDQNKCEQMSLVGLKVLEAKLQLGMKPNARVQLLTHCNTGSLATAGTGTALGVIKKISEIYPQALTYVDETRPLLQGARLTAWELGLSHAKHKLICDNMAGFLMLQNQVDAVMVGADRITAEGDTANKIGTYSLAVLCQYHNIPFYIVAPTTTIDSSLSSGFEIPIEERAAQEVQMNWSLQTTEVYNPAFDWVPHHLVTGWITEEGFFDNKAVAGGAFKSYFKTITGVN